jgi:hypothetical protein
MHEPPEYTTRVPLKTKHQVYFNGGGVLQNDSPSTTYTVTSVSLDNMQNLVQVGASLVPDVQGGGMLNSVVDDLTPRLARRIGNKDAEWPWERRVPAVGATIGPGQSWEIVVAFMGQSPEPWRFSSIRTDYTDGLVNSPTLPRPPAPVAWPSVRHEVLGRRVHAG